MTVTCVRWMYLGVAGRGVEITSPDCARSTVPCSVLPSPKASRSVQRFFASLQQGCQPVCATWCRGGCVFAGRASGRLKLHRGGLSACRAVYAVTLSQLAGLRCSLTTCLCLSRGFCVAASDRCAFRTRLSYLKLSEWLRNTAVRGLRLSRLEARAAPVAGRGRPGWLGPRLTLHCLVACCAEVLQVQAYSLARWAEWAQGCKLLAAASGCSDQAGDEGVALICMSASAYPLCTP